MTNRDKLLETNEYDLLVKIQEAMVDGCCCIIDAISGQRYPCKWYDETDRALSDDCKDCIQKWLHEKGVRGWS